MPSTVHSLGGLRLASGSSASLNFFPPTSSAYVTFFDASLFDADDAIPRRQLIHRNTQFLRCHLHQRLARRRRRLRQIFMIEIRGMRLAAGRDALIRRHTRYRSKSE